MSGILCDGVEMGPRAGRMSRTPPKRSWQSCRPAASGAEAMDEPFNAFPTWFLRVECDRCGKLRMLNQTHMRGSDMPIRDIIGRMRHDICGGGAGKAELLARHRGRASSRPVHQIGPGPGDELQAGQELMMDMHARALAAAQDQLGLVRDAAEGGCAKPRPGGRRGGDDRPSDPQRSLVVPAHRVRSLRPGAHDPRRRTYPCPL